MNQVVVTGLGCVTPCGHDLKSTWHAVKSGISGLDNIGAFDASQFLVKVSGEVKGFSLDEYGIDHKISRKLSRFQRLALGSSVEAVRDAGLDCDGVFNEDLSRACIISGVGVGLSDALEDSYRKMLATADGINRISPLTAPQCLPNEAASAVSMYYGIKGCALTVSTACASGSDAVGIAANMIERGPYDVAIAIGCDANVTPFAIAAYQAIGALCTGYENDPKKACQPFNKGHAGFIMAEGAATLILEKESHAKARGAHIYGRILGYGATSDAHHLTAPLKDGSGGVAAMDMALKDAGLNARDIQYYNAHGTSTVANDAAESAMIKTVFGTWADPKAPEHLKISSTKSTTGHLIGAAGAAEAIFCLMAMKDEFVPPTINLSEPDLEHGCDLDYTPNEGVPLKITHSASCSLGFGGHNACLVLGI